MVGVGEQFPHDYLYWGFHSQGGKQAVRYGRWKGSRLGMNQDRKGSVEICDLRIDLGEQLNVADQ